MIQYMDFVHYTKKIEAILGILEHGLLLNPLPRKVMHLFSNSIKFENRDPQQFGLASLRREWIFGSRRHAKEFGKFGIVFDPSWVSNRKFRKVIYIKEDTKLHYDLKKLFEVAESELITKLSKRSPDNIYSNMAWTNKNMALMHGARKYGDFLSLYEILEPHGNKWQNEWRAVQNEPFYTDGSTEDHVKSISRPGWNNIIMTLKFEPKDVLHFVTKLGNVSLLKNALPKDYKDKEVRWKIFT